MEDKEILTEVTKYLDYLETPSDNFGGMPVCPFLKKDKLNEIDEEYFNNRWEIITKKK